MSQSPADVHGLRNETTGGENAESARVTAISCVPLAPCRDVELFAGNPPVAINDRGAPPSYEEVIDLNAPPPSYDSLFGRVRQAHKASKGVFDFLRNIVILLLGTIGCTIVIGMMLIVPVSMIVIGSIYLYDCPQGEYIPVYLLVGGVFGLFKQLLDLSVRLPSHHDDEERTRQTPTQTLIGCFMLGWFIIGSMWVYKEYEPNFDPALGKYCNKTLYRFAFWLITSSYIVMGVLTVAVCSISIASIAFQ